MHRKDLRATQRGDAGDLALDDVRVDVEHDFGAARGEHPHGGLVRHDAARKEQRGFLAEELGDFRLELAGGRVAVALVVADFGIGHRLAHAGRGLRNGIGTQIDH
jgi:hypothetical protein